ncbi:MAG TPA: hypothetical protein VMU48_03480 [Terracidiphilus sp.]|nr:hypothetical protein [Terracidiphilus sp.]
MDGKPELDPDAARKAPLEQIPTLVHEHREDVIRGLLENPLKNSIYVYCSAARS